MLFALSRVAVCPFVVPQLRRLISREVLVLVLLGRQDGCGEALRPLGRIGFVARLVVEEPDVVLRASLRSAREASADPRDEVVRVLCLLTNSNLPTKYKSLVAAISDASV